MRKGAVLRVCARISHDLLESYPIGVPVCCSVNSVLLSVLVCVACDWLDSSGKSKSVETVKVVNMSPVFS